MEAQQLREIIIKELPILIQNDENFRRIILKISRTQFAGKAETENRIDRMMDMLEIRIKEDAKNWDEQREKWKLHEIERKKELEAQDARWIAEREIQDKKWEENQQVIRNMMVEIQSLNRKHDSYFSHDR
ncbi:MAG: hypothetical protein KAG43_10245 [Candidatus Marithrix sp.]|nr:hypothetical protein [Candidatus Marithrix sp.]